MFRAGLLLIISRYNSVYTEIGMRHALMLTGCWQDPDPANSQSTLTDLQCVYKGIASRISVNFMEVVGFGNVQVQRPTRLQIFWKTWKFLILLDEQ